MGILGVKQKLDLAFFSIASFSIVIMVIACTFMINVGVLVEGVSSHLVPKLSLASKLQKTSEKTNLLIDKISSNESNARKIEDLIALEKSWSELIAIVSQVQSRINGLSDRIGFTDELDSLKIIHADHGIIRDVVFDHSNAIIGREKTHESMLRLIRIYDDYMLPKISDRTVDIRKQGRDNIYQAGNDLSNYLLSVNSEDKSQVINRLKRRCLMLFVSLQKMSETSSLEVRLFMRDWLARVSPLLRGNSSVFVLRLDEIRIGNVINKQFLLNQSIVISLEKKAEILLVEMQKSISETTFSAHQRIRSYVYVLAIISLVSISVSAVLVWSLVHRNVISRLLHTSEAIIKLSRGNIDIDISHPADDELGQMQIALEKLREYVIRVQTASKTDSLTGLNNRGSFDSLLKMELGSLADTAREMSLLMLDIDYFKNYNDEYGHVKGDGCIQAVSEVLQNHCRRDGDVVARYGGEEFVMILPATSNEHAVNLAESIRLAIQDLGIPHIKSLAAKCVTVSVGVSTITFHEKTQPEDFIKLADIALYKAKNSGRNCVESLS
ncbi:hypothetical protein A9Q99_26385 [Gammaproteobacteria bacterium 45_16_T64]|nr:hypothetical protein A9Q99_26385 [Gammaproteobacteria bacterium 45_16_T64]